MWKGITSKCQELGCRYSKKLESDQTALGEKKFRCDSPLILFVLEKNWKFVSAKKNELSMTRAVKASFNNLASYLPSPDNTEPAVNISEDTTKDEIVNITESVLSAIDADCAEDSCSYSEGLKTSATTTLDSKWLEVNSKKNATSIKEVLETSFADFEKLLPIPSFSAKTSNITDNTTIDELKAIVEEFWKDLNEECSGGDCKLSADIKTNTITTLGELTLV